MYLNKESSLLALARDERVQLCCEGVLHERQRGNRKYNCVSVSVSVSVSNLSRCCILSSSCHNKRAAISSSGARAYAALLELRVELVEIVLQRGQLAARAERVDRVARRVRVEGRAGARRVLAAAAVRCRVERQRQGDVRVAVRRGSGAQTGLVDVVRRRVRERHGPGALALAVHRVRIARLGRVQV